MTWRYSDGPPGLHGSGGGGASLIDRLPTPCALIDVKGVVRETNNAWRGEAGQHHFLATPGSSLVDAVRQHARSTQAAEGLAAVIAGERESLSFELVSAGRAGSRRFRLMAAANPLGGAAVVIVDVAGEGADIATGEQLREMLETVADHALFTLDAQRRINTWNLGARRLLGYDEQQVLGRGVSMFFTPEDQSAGLVEREFAQAEQNGRYDDEGWRIRKDGTRFWARVTTTALRERGGALRGFSKVVRDMTERRASEAALRESQSRLAGIIDSAMDAIITVDESQKVVMFNHAAERIFGVKAQDAIGGGLDRFVPMRYRHSHSQHIRGFGTTGVTQRAMGRLGTLNGVRTDGTEFPIEASISQAVASGQKFFTVILRDVSERKKLEEQFLQSQKMEGIGRLAGGVAHDFNNLLMAFFGYIGVAAANLPPDHPAQSALNHAREAAERAAALTRQLLTFARKQIITPKVVSLNTIVTGVEPMLRRLLTEDITLRCVADPAAGSIRADASQVEQVIVNLAVNARDAMPRGGMLTIETRNIHLDKEYCHARTGASVGPHVELAVCDTGIGMPPEVMERLFEPFFTTKGPGKGTGLGLATCHGIVRQCGGHIAVYSEIGRGTSVKVYFPRAESEHGHAAAGVARPGPVQGKETILLVEDNAMVRDLVAMGLKRAGFSVLLASTGSHALKVAEEAGGTIDLLLTDVVMPEMGGVALAEALTRRHKALRVLFMSGYTEETIVHHGVETESVAFIAKPFEVTALLEKVRAVLDARTGR